MIQSKKDGLRSSLFSILFSGAMLAAALCMIGCASFPSVHPTVSLPRTGTPEFAAPIAAIAFQQYADGMHTGIKNAGSVFADRNEKAIDYDYDSGVMPKKFRTVVYPTARHAFPFKNKLPHVTPLRALARAYECSQDLYGNWYWQKRQLRLVKSRRNGPTELLWWDIFERPQDTVGRPSASDIALLSTRLGLGGDAFECEVRADETVTGIRKRANEDFLRLPKVTINTPKVLASLSDDDRILQFEVINNFNSNFPLTVGTSCLTVFSLSVIPVVGIRTIDLHVTIVDRHGRSYWEKSYSGSVRRIVGLVGLFFFQDRQTEFGGEPAKAEMVLQALMEDAVADVLELNVTELDSLP